MQGPPFPYQTHGGSLLSSASCPERSSWCLLPSVPAPLPHVLANVPWPGHPDRALIGERRGQQGRGEPGLGKAQPPSLTFHCVCHFLLGRKVLRVTIFCFNNLRGSHVPRSPCIASPSLGRFPAQPLHVGIARADRLPPAGVSAPQISPFTEPREPRVSWESLFRTFPQRFGKLVRKTGSFPCGITGGQEVGWSREQELHIPGADTVSVQRPVPWPQHPTHREVVLRLLHLNMLFLTRKDPVDKLKIQEMDVKTSVGDCTNGKRILFNVISKTTSSTHPQHPHECSSGLARITCM